MIYKHARALDCEEASCQSGSARPTGMGDHLIG
jgi:hypothetical protein